MNNNYSDEFIAVQKDLLNIEKTRLEKDLETVATFDESQGRYVPKHEEFNPNASEDADEATDEAINFGENTAMADTLIKSLTEVKDALQAIEEGKYGQCDECETHNISEERLKAYPAAKTCIQCG